MMRMGESGNTSTQSIADYLAQLLKDKKQLAAFPNVFVHMERLLDDGKAFQCTYIFF
jgi:protein quaking